MVILIFLSISLRRDNLQAKGSSLQRIKLSVIGADWTPLCTLARIPPSSSDKVRVLRNARSISLVSKESASELVYFYPSIDHGR